MPNNIGHLIPTKPFINRGDPMQLYAFAGKSGCFNTYTASVKAEQLGAMFANYYELAKNKDTSPHDRAQRLIDMAHVRRIISYLDRPVRAFGSPVATGKVLSVEPTDIPGLCLITLDTQTLHLVDGQKRVLGCIQKHSECSDFSDSVPLLLVDTVELRARKQLFSSINSTAAKVSSSLNAIYDLQSALASFIPETFPVELLEVEKATVAKSSDKLLTPGIAKEAIASLLSIPVKTLETLPLDKIESAWDYWHPYVSRIFDVIVRLAEKEGGLPALRESSILPHNVGFLAVIRLLPLMRQQGLPPETIDLIVDLHDQGDTSRANSVWDGRCVSFGSMKKNSRSVDSTAAMLATMLDIDPGQTLGLFL